MKSLFTFTFDNSKPVYYRKYTFGLDFSNKTEYEKALDWAETGNDLVTFVHEMEDKYGVHEVDYDPKKEFYGIESSGIQPKNYIKVVECWRDFFVNHNIDCGDITEVIEDKIIVTG